MKRTLLFIGLMLITLLSGAQNTKRSTNRVDSVESDATTLSTGDLAQLNLTNAESEQLVESPNYTVPEPKIKEKLTDPGVVIFKNPDGTERIALDWTTGQHARSLVETIRISIWRYQAGKANPAGAIGVPQAVEAWPKLLSIFCREYPGGQYIDLQGQAQFCEERKH